MPDRPSSSRNPEGDSSPERSLPSSPSNRDLTRMLFTHSSDHQASTSSSLSDATRPGSESRNDSPEKRFQDLLAKLEERPRVSKETLEEYKHDFQKKANESESEQKEYIKDLEKHLEIDTAIGDVLFTTKSEQEVTEGRISVLVFLSNKIKNTSDTRDKRTIFVDWSHAVNQYCMDHSELLNDNMYNTSSIDMKYCLEANRNKIKALDTSEQSNSQERPEGTNSSDNPHKQSDNYKGPNLRVYKEITAINETLYTEQERTHRIRLDIFRSSDQLQRKYLVQDLSPEQSLAIFQDLDHHEQLEFYGILTDDEMRSIPDLQFDYKRRYLVQRLDSQQHIGLFKGLELQQQKDLFNDLNPQQQKDLFNGLNPQHQKELLFNCLNFKQQKELFNGLNLQQQKKLFNDLDPQQQQRLYQQLQLEAFPKLDPQQQRDLYLGLDSQQQPELVQGLVQGLDPQQQRELYLGIDPQQQRELYLGLDHQQRRELVQGLNSQQQRELCLGLDHQQRRELVQGLNSQQQRSLYLGLGLQQKRELVNGLDHQQTRELYQNIYRDQRLELYLSLDHQQTRKLVNDLPNNQIRELFQDLNRYQRSKLYLDLDVLQKQELDPEIRQMLSEDLAINPELHHDLDPQQQIEHFRSLDPQQQIEHFRSLDPQQQIEHFRSLDPQQQIELVFYFPNQQRDVLIHDLDRQQRLELYLGSNTHQRDYLCDTCFYQQEHIELFQDLNRYQRMDLYQKLYNRHKIAIIHNLDRQQRLELYLDSDSPQQRVLCGNLYTQQRRDLFKDLHSHYQQNRDVDTHQLQNIVQDLKPQRSLEFFQGLDRQQRQDLVKYLNPEQLLGLCQRLEAQQQLQTLVSDLSQSLGSPSSEQSPLERYLDISRQQMRDLVKDIKQLHPEALTLIHKSLEGPLERIGTAELIHKLCHINPPVRRINKKILRLVPLVLARAWLSLTAQVTSTSWSSLVEICKDTTKSMQHATVMI